MPADASTPLNRRTFLGIADEVATHVSSLVVRAVPERLADVTRRIGALNAAEVALSDASGKIVVTLETTDEAEIVGAMSAMQHMNGVVSVALVYHLSESEGAKS
jgi:nitrate reductase NapD